MIRLVLLAMVCCSCGGSSEVWLDGYERGATITKRVGEFFSLKVKTSGGGGSGGTSIPFFGMSIKDSDGNEIDHALMRWGFSSFAIRAGGAELHFEELFLAKDLPKEAKLKVSWYAGGASYNIKSTPGPYMFSAPPEFISLESMPVQLQWRLSYNTELQTGDVITWNLCGRMLGGMCNQRYNEAQHTVRSTTSTVLINVGEEEDITDYTTEDICIFFAKITRAGKDISVNAAPTRSSTDC